MGGWIDKEHSNTSYLEDFKDYHSMVEMILYILSWMHVIRTKRLHCPVNGTRVVGPPLESYLLLEMVERWNLSWNLGQWKAGRSRVLVYLWRLPEW
jgi:hypothetical protein